VAKGFQHKRRPTLGLKRTPEAPLSPILVGRPETYHQDVSAGRKCLLLEALETRWRSWSRKGPW